MDISQNESGAPEQDQETTAVSDVQTNQEQTEPEAPKTFTQQELTAVVGKELAKAQRKWDREQAARAVGVQRPIAPPNPTQFTSQEAFVDALVDFRADQKVAQREAQQQHVQNDAAYEKRVEAAMEKYDDFEMVGKLPKDGGPSITDHMAEVIKASDIGPEIAYHLYKNIPDSRRICGLPPLQQARELGKIEASLTMNPPANKVTSAPDPINPIGSRSTSVKVSTSDPRSDKTHSDSGWIAQRNRELKQRAQQG